MATTEATRSTKRVRSPSAEPPQRRSRAFRWGALVMLVMLAAGLYFAPAIVAVTPLANLILRVAVPLNGTISVGSAALGWFSSVVVENLEIRDAQGASVLEIESLTSDKPLVAMLLDLGDVGRLQVVRPTLHIVAHEKDCNLEDVFNPLLESQGQFRTTAQLAVSEGTLIIDDVTAARQSRFESLAVDCNLAGGDGTLTIAMSGALAGGRQPGTFKVDATIKGSAANGNPLASGKIDCEASALPLDVLDPVLRRAIDHAQLGGLLTARLQGAWGELAEGGENGVHGEALVTGFDFSAPALGADHLRFQRVEMPCHLAQKDDWIQAEQLALNCDLGEVSLSGSIKTTDLAAADRWAALWRQSYQVKGRIDLAALAEMLGHTLSLREGMQIVSGQLTFDAASSPQPDGMEWTAHVDSTPLAAKIDGRDLAWNNPLAIELFARETKDGVVIEQARCDSSFLQVNAAGTPENLTASADFDLARLVAELRKFCALDELQLAGHAQAQLVWKRAGSDNFQADAELQARGFQWIVGSQRPWTEDNLIVKLAIGGRMQDRVVTQVEQAQLTIVSAGERAEVRLLEAISDPASAAWPVSCTWTGDVAHWSPRLESCLAVGNWDVAGSGSLQATAHVSRKTLDVERANFDVTKFELRGQSYDIREPAVAIVLAGKCDLAARSVEVAQAEFSAGASQANLQHIRIEHQAAGTSLDATGHVTADLAQLYRWQHDPRAPAAWQVSGALDGQIQLKSQPGSTSGEFDGAIDKFQIVDHSQPPAPGGVPAAWHEPHVSLAALASYQNGAGTLTFEKLQVTSHALRCAASGTVPVSAAGGDINLKGTIEYDWQQLAPVWQPYLGAGVEIAGHQTREFTVHGPLTGAPTQVAAWKNVQAEAALGWTDMNFHGLVVGRADIAAQLANGQLQTGQIDIPINEGRLTLAPVVRLDANPPVVLLGSGPMLNDVHLSPELCARGLKFVAPILANSTVADGRFSVTLGGGRVPLTDPGGGDIAGQMALRAQAKPGPVAQEFLILIKELTTILQRGALASLSDQSGALVSIDDSDIEFRCVNRRVYHRGLQFTVGTTPITTYGWVGLDETLAIVAEVPIQAKLFGIDLSLGTLEGQVLQIPIEGTLLKPTLDRRVLTQLTGQMVKNTARGVLIDGVGKQLERLFPKQP